MSKYSQFKDLLNGQAGSYYYAASNPNGYTNDQTAGEIKTALLTVDGAGSGIDSDLLDGQQGSYYLEQSTGKSIMYVDDGTSGGLNYVVNPIAGNTPPTAYYTGMVVRFVPLTSSASGTETINVAGLGVKNLREGGGGFIYAGVMLAGRMQDAVYNGTDFDITPTSVGRAGSTQLGLLNHPVSGLATTSAYYIDKNSVFGSTGFHIQSGRAVVTVATSATITLPSAFDSTFISVVVTPIAGAPGDTGTVSAIRSAGLTGFVINNKMTTSSNFDWIATGW